MCLHLLGHALEDIYVLVPFLELELDFLITPDGDDIPHLPVLLVVCQGLAGEGGWGKVIPGPRWCLWGLGMHW